MSLIPARSIQLSFPLQTPKPLNLSTASLLNFPVWRVLFSFQVSAFETHSLPKLTRSYPRRFTFYVAHPISLHSAFSTPRPVYSATLSFSAFRFQRFSFH